VAVYYLVYTQIEAYVIGPFIMNRAVKVPGVLVIIAALAGGALMGVLGAIVAIPIAASVLIIVRQVLIPAQELR
jgi:predicted PurR-regulated permease PerM